MKTQDIENRYKKMVSTIEDAKIYDGRGIYDLYVCEKCQNQKITLYKDKGVTPFMIGCNCGGSMQHTKSFKSVPDYVRVDNWIRPSLEQLNQLSTGLIEHILNGGLVLSSEVYLAMLKKQIKQSVI